MDIKKINKAINDLQEFLECDLYSKLRPEMMVGNKKMYREDFIKTEEEFYDYLKGHFDILRKELNADFKPRQHRKCDDEYFDKLNKACIKPKANRSKD